MAVACFAGFFACRIVAVLRDVRGDRHCGNGAAHLAFARSISTGFQKRTGDGARLRDAGAGLGAMVLQ